MFFIVWGAKAVERVLKNGNFFCPECGVERNYSHIKVMKYFTLYWIPLFSTETIGEYVKCMVCNSYFKPAVIDYKPEQKELTDHEMDRVFHDCFENILLKMLLVDGVIDDNEIKAFQSIVTKMTGSIPTDELVYQKIEKVKLNREPLETYVNLLSSLCNDSGKMMIFQGSLLIAASDGHLDDSELTLILQKVHDFKCAGSMRDSILS